MSIQSLRTDPQAVFYKKDRKNMKRVLTILIMLSIIFTLTSCGHKKEEPAVSLEGLASVDFADSEKTGVRFVINGKKYLIYATPFKGYDGSRLISIGDVYAYEFVDYFYRYYLSFNGLSKNEWLLKVRLEDPKKGFVMDNVKSLWIMKAEDAPAGPQWLEDYHAAYLNYLEKLK